MHDPDVVVFDLHLPIPARLWPGWGGAPRWSIKPRRYIGGDRHGKYMYPWWRPAQWRVFAAGREVKLYDLATVWHVEPGGADSGTVCKGMRGSQLTWHNARWAWRHRDHIKIHWTTWRKVDRWLHRRCAECGGRFKYGAASFGYWGGDESYHETCMDLQHARAQREDLLAYIAGERDFSREFRIERMLQHRKERAS